MIPHPGPLPKGEGVGVSVELLPLLVREGGAVMDRLTPSPFGRGLG